MVSQVTPSYGTSQLVQSLGEVPTLNMKEKFTAGYNSMEYGASLTGALYDIYDNYKHRNDNSPIMSAEDADLLYPVANKRTAPVTEYKASKGYYRHKYSTRLNEAIARSQNSFGGTLTGFAGSFAGAVVNDPVMMVGAMGVGSLITSGAKGAALTASIYNTYEFLGAGALRAAATRASVEAIGSLAWDIPAQMLTQQLINHSDSMGIEMTGHEVANNVMMGAMFAGVVGGISGLKNRADVAATAETYMRYNKVKAAAEASGIDIGVKLSDIDMEGLKAKMSAEGHGLIRELDEAGVFARGADGRIYSSFDMIKAGRNLDVVGVFKSDAFVVSKARFTEEFSAVALKSEHKELISSFLEYIQGSSIFNLNKAVLDGEAPVPFRSLFTKTLENIKKDVADVGIIDDLEVAKLKEGSIEAAPPKDIKLGKGPLRGYTDQGEPIWSRVALATEDTYVNPSTAGLEQGMVKRQLSIMEQLRLASEHYGKAEDSLIGGLISSKIQHIADRDFPMTTALKETVKDNATILKSFGDTLDLIFGDDAYKILDNQVELTTKTFLKFFTKQGKMRIKGSDLGKNMKHMANFGKKQRGMFDAAIKGLEEDLAVFEKNIGHLKDNEFDYTGVQEEELMTKVAKKIEGINKLIGDVKAKSALWEMFDQQKAKIKLKELNKRRADIAKLEDKLLKEIDPMLICDL